MRNFVMVVFAEDVAEGLVFPRDDWPLHITLLRFDVDSSPGDPSDVVHHLAELAAAPVKGALGAELTVGADKRFGRQGSIPVSLVQHHPLLQGLHEELFGAVADLGGNVATPHHTLAGYRPHISHHNGKRPHEGDAVLLDRVALVDMAPGGKHTIRRVLKLWRLAPELRLEQRPEKP
jgi:2'-5' RNA ligase superfamily